RSSTSATTSRSSPSTAWRGSRAEPLASRAPVHCSPMRYAPHTDDDVREMLERCGVAMLDDLFSTIPEPVRLRGGLDLPDGVSEMEIVADLRELASRNRSADDLICFAGGGAYDHSLPSAVWP